MATKGTRSESISVQDIAVQSQALLNIKDSNKVLLAEVGIPNVAYNLQKMYGWTVIWIGLHAGR